MLLILGVTWCSLNREKLSTAWADVEKKLSAMMGKKPADDESADEAEEATTDSEAAPSTEEAVAVNAPPVTLPTPPAPVSSDLPEGHFYTLERISQTGASGIVAIPAGTLVRKISEVDGKFLIEDVVKKVQLQAGSWLLTRVKPANAEPASSAPAPGATRPGGSSTPPATPSPQQIAAEERKMEREAQRKTAQENQLKKQQIHAQLRILDAQISQMSNELATAEYKAGSRGTNSHGVTAARIRPQLEKLKAQRDSLQLMLASIP